jgi:UDP-galactopyranose mutase
MALKQNVTLEWQEINKLFYPVNGERNNNLYQRYYKLAQQEKILFSVDDWLNINITIWMTL